MDRRLLTQRIRLLGIPILIPAAVLVLVAYGLPQPNPVPAQAVTPINIRGPVAHLNKCWVRPFRARVRTKAQGGQARFNNTTAGTLVLFFPTGKLLWEPVPDVATQDNSRTYTILPHEFKLLTVSAKAQVGDNEYEAYSDEVGFCLGESHPTIIVY